MEINLEITKRVTSDITAQFTSEEVADAINDLPMAKRWNFIANLLNELELSEEGLETDQKRILLEFLERKSKSIKATTDN